MEVYMVKKEKICPILNIGNGFLGKNVNGDFAGDTIKKHIIKCLKEDCELWTNHYVRDSIRIKIDGRCGLKGDNQ
jgi:hypothetical protein